MNKQIFFLLVIFFMAISSCDPCRNLDCRYSDFSSQFRILKQPGGSDLVFGASSMYEKNKIKFFALKGADTIVFPWQAFKDLVSGDSILLVNFYPKSDTVFLRLNELDTDTLELHFTNLNSRCCGTVSEINGIQFNKTVNLPGANHQQVIYK